MVLIVLKVRRVEERLGRYAIGNSSTGVVRGNEPSFLRTKATSRQALLYIAIFFITYIPLALRWAFDTDADAQNARDFVLALLVKVLTPMQVRTKNPNSRLVSRVCMRLFLARHICVFVDRVFLMRLCIFERRF